MSEGTLKLTQAQRAGFFTRDKSVPWPVLAGEGVPPVKAGYVHKLSSRMSIEIIRVHIKRGRWRLEYKLHDDRDPKFYLMPGGVTLETDEKGNLTDTMPPEEEIGYTQNPKRRRLDPLPTVPPDVQNVITMRAKLEGAQRSSSQSERNSQARSVREKLHRTLDGLSPEGQVALLAGIERQMQEAIAQEREAA